jgi:hypothetical protein
MKEPTKCTSVRVACEGIKDPLPSARSRGHSPKRSLPSAKTRASAKGSLPSARFLFFYFSTHQRELLKCGNLCRVSTNWTLGKDNICRALFCDTRQKYIYFFPFSTQTFSIVILDYLELHMQAWHITRIVCYI